MILIWMAYVTIVGALLAVAARAGEELLRGRIAGTRWLWLGAGFGVFALGALAFVRGVDRDARVVLEGPHGGATEEVAEALAPAHRPSGSAPVPVEEGAVLRRFAEIVGPARLRALDAPLLVGWLATSLVLAIVLSGTLLVARSRRREWRVQDLGGVTVCVSTREGPALIGLVRPAIVVPEWLLDRDREEVRLAVAHEVEHRRAADPMTLLVGSLLLLIFPWNPFVWWIHSRLRLAVEIDCDRRIVRGGARRLDYGNLLLDIAARRDAAPALGAIPLLGSRSHLERRIEAMSSKSSGLYTMRSGLAIAATALAVFAACDTGIPTAAELEALDVERAEARATALFGRAEGQERTFMIDGVVVTRDAATALMPDEIASIEVVRARRSSGATAGREAEQVVRITTSPGDRLSAERIVWAPERVPSGDAAVAVTVEVQPPQATDSSIDVGVHSGSPGRTEPIIFSGQVVTAPPIARERPLIFVDGVLMMDVAKPAPLIFVDGVEQPRGAKLSLDPSSIESTEVVKGPAAVRIYGPTAASGVIDIRLKR